MQSTQKIWIGTGIVAASAAFMLLQQPSVQAFAPPDKSVVVVNAPNEPVPVTGSVAVTGSTSVSGSVYAAQDGYWNVGASQSGAWTVGINPAQNTVKAEAPSVFYDSGFGVINDGDTLNLPAVDLSKVRTARVIVYAVNGEIHAQIRAATANFEFPLDQLDADGEDNSFQTKQIVYDAPPPSIYVRLTESGPGGSNYRVMIIGR